MDPALQFHRAEEFEVVPRGTVIEITYGSVFMFPDGSSQRVEQYRERMVVDPAELECMLKEATVISSGAYLHS